MTETLEDTCSVKGHVAPAEHSADADRIIEAIERPNQWTPETEYVAQFGKETRKKEPIKDRWLPKMDLPGFGEKYDDCGDDMPRFCGCCGETVTVGRTCRRSTCPRCAQMWCMGQASSLVAKLESVWAYQYAALKSHPYYHHLVIDIPEDWILDGDPETVYWRTLDVIKEILDELGVAGIPIYHPYRGESEDGEDDLGEWKGRMFADRDWSDVSGELEFSPHFHILGVSPHVDVSVSERVHDKTGWIIHRITQDGSNVSIGNTYDLARAAAYCLSHAGIYEDSNGDMSAAYHPRISERVPEGNPTPDEETREQSDVIVRATAPKTLDIEYQAVACTASVPSEAAANRAERVSLAAGSASGSSDSSSASDSDDRDPESGDSHKQECKGRMFHISRAPGYFNDPDWRERAIAVDHLERVYREWKREQGVA